MKNLEIRHNLRYTFDRHGGWVNEGSRICFLYVHASGGPMKGRALLARLCVLLAIVEVARSLADSLAALHPHHCTAASFHRTSGVKMREQPPSARNFVDMSSSDFRRPYTGRSNSAAPSQGSMRATPGSFGMGATGNFGSSLGRGPTMGVVVPSNAGRPRNFVSPADEVRAIARAAARAADAATNSRAAASVASEGEVARSTMPLPPGAALPQTMFGGFDATARAAARGANGFPAGVGPPQGVAAAEDLSSSSGGYDSYAARLAVRRAAQEAAMNPLQRAANAFTKPFRSLSKPSVYTPGFGAGYDGMGPDVPLAAAGGAFRAGQPAGIWEAAWGGGTTPVRKKTAPELLFSSANVPGWPAPSTYLGYRPGGGGGGGGAVKTALAITLAVGVITLGPQATFDVLKTEVAPPARGGIEAVGKGVEIISKVVTVPAEVIVRKSGVVEGVTSWANQLRADSWAQLQPETRDSLEQRQATLAEAGRVVGRGTIDAEVVSLRTAKDLAQGAATLAKEVATVMGEALLETSQLLGEKLQEVTGFELGGGEEADEEEEDGEEAEEEEEEEEVVEDAEEAEEAEATLARPGRAAGIDAAAEEMALLKQEVAALKAKAEVFAAAAEQAEQAAAKASAEAATASAEAMRLAAEKEALAALKAEAEQAAAKASAEAATASAEAMRLAAEKAEMEQAAAERAMEQAAAERAQATQLEAEQLAKRAEAEQLAADRAEAEAERAAAERAEAEAERFALERREAGRAAAKRAAAQRLEWDQIVAEAAEARASAQAAEAKAAEAARAAQAAADEALEAKRAAAATPSAAEWEPPRGAGRSPRGNGRAAEYDANARAAARAKARARAARPAERVPIQLPDGVVPNQQYRATLDDGSDVMFTAPADARAGQVIELELMPASTRSRAS